MAEQDSNIQNHVNTARAGMDLDSSINQIPNSKLSYALNANIENYDNNSVSYQNEQGNELCLKFPDGYVAIGNPYYIPEKTKHIFWLSGPNGESEIGYMDNNDCIYHTLINSYCLNFNKNFPILKAVHKITNCSVEVYWTDGYNNRRFVDLNNLPYKIIEGENICEDQVTNEIDCNKLNIQPDFSIPQLTVTDVVSGGSLTAGTVQFAIQYSDSQGGAYTSYYSVTNPTPIADSRVTTLDFNYPVGKSVQLNIKNIDVTGYFKYFNLAVIKTVNNITSVELIGTYLIDSREKNIIYNGQNQTQIRLSISDIFEKFPIYEIAQDLTSVQDVLIWDQLSSIDRINYQQIANQITLKWESYRIPNTENYSDELNATNLRGYLRDEVYPFEIIFLKTNGKQTDGFHIPGRELTDAEKLLPEISNDPLSPNYSLDFVGSESPAPYWKIYNLGSVTGTNPDYVPHSSYKGPYQYGEFAYWESKETYPCDTNVWGDLAGKPIRHHKFPDLLVSPIFENPDIEVDGGGKYVNLQMQKNAIFPIGVRIDVSQIQELINQSSLSQQEKIDIVGFKIVRGNRDVNKSIVAKGILRNVGKYNREGTNYWFPNYPYNDLRKDPFLLKTSNKTVNVCYGYRIASLSTVGTYTYTDCNSGLSVTSPIGVGEGFNVCSLTLPTTSDVGITVSALDFDTYILSATYTGAIFDGFVEFTYTSFATGSPTVVTLDHLYFDHPTKSVTVQVVASSVPTITDSSLASGSVTLTTNSQVDVCYPEQLDAFGTDFSDLFGTQERHVFNSPETSFGQPFLGTILKVENVIFGAGKGHFVPVENNALYKLLTKEAQEDALKSSAELAQITTPFNSTAMFTAYQSYLQIYTNGITRQNYGYSYNSILNYDYFSPVNNADGLGIKQRNLTTAQYLYPGFQSVGESISINNYQRESSVYLRTSGFPLPYPSDTTSLLISPGDSKITDVSRHINSEYDCTAPEKQFDISSVVYYASIKNDIPNQWGQMYSYETIDTGTQVIFSSTTEQTLIVFGGDTFINEFSFKTKLPFFIDNRVNAPNDSDVYYDEIGNVAYPEYWHSARSILYDYDATPYGGSVFTNIISIKAHYFDCPNNQLPAPDSTVDPPIVNTNRTFYGGKMYMFAYGIPTFYCESSINVDLRQAFNNKEGDFYPHVSSSIPDKWVQENFVPIAQDNTYYYNVTYSKQNKENYFSHLPTNWTENDCLTHFPFRAIYSDEQKSFTDNVTNNWLIYRPVSYFDFPQSYGNLTSLDGIQNKQVLARFENKLLLYNALYTNVINTGGQVYLGQNLFSKTTPPLDFSETDTGYAGSQHKFLLKIPQGQITIDAKRGQVFLLSGNNLKDISALGSGLNHFLTDHLSFEILKYFPDVNIDNHPNGIGLHGIYDGRYDRVIISKLDYIPLTDDVKFDSETQEFYTETLFNDMIFKNIIELNDSNYFCNKSWTLSYNMNTQSWISFHTYIPNFYVAENNFFYSGINESCGLTAIASEIVPDCSLASNGFQIINCTLSGTAQQQ